MEFRDLKRYLDENNKQIIPYCEIRVMRDHEILCEYETGETGFVEKEQGKKLYFMYSMTKPLTCACVMRLIEEGKLSLDDPVDKYLPEFRKMTIRAGDKTLPAFNRITIEHLMTMTSGITYDIGNEAIRKIKEEKTNGTTRDFMKGIAAMSLSFEPGTRFEYGLNHDVLGAVIEVVTGMRFGEYMAKVLFDPLGMRDTTFHPTPAILDRMHTQYAVQNESQKAVAIDKINSFAFSDAYESGGAGLTSSLHDYALFADAMASGTSPDGYRVLKPETIDMMRTAHVLSPARPGFDSRPGFSYGLGVQTVVDPAKDGSGISVGAFGWDGAAASYISIDPERKVSIVYCQHVLNCGLGYVAHRMIRRHVYNGLAE